jgi:hypothetical protein
MKRLIWIFIVPLLAGCSTSTEFFVFDCVIQNALNNAPLEGAAIVLQGQRVTGGSFNPNFQTLGTATTDANGHFVLEVDKELFNAYRLNISLPQYFNTSVAISPDDVPLVRPTPTLLASNQKLGFLREFAILLNRNT